MALCTAALSRIALVITASESIVIWAEDLKACLKGGIFREERYNRVNRTIAESTIRKERLISTRCALSIRQSQIGVSMQVSMNMSVRFHMEGQIRIEDQSGKGIEDSGKVKCYTRFCTPTRTETCTEMFFFFNVSEIHDLHTFDNDSHTFEKNDRILVFDSEALFSTPVRASQ